jgi:hypothetical protein
MKPNLLIKIKKKVNKRLEPGFLKDIKDPQLVSNIVAALKKDEIV